jgi:choice-of-anchor A domain-containing protein
MQLLSNLLHSIRLVERTANRLNSARVHLSLSVLEDRVQPSTNPVDLGAAGDYAVLGLHRTYIENQQSLIAGDVGVSQRGGLRNEVRSSIQGDLDVWSKSQVSGRGTVTGTLTVNQAQLNNADHDALDASSVASRLKATQTFRRIDRATTVSGNGDLNVISVRGDVTASLTLSGSANDIFIVNVQGDLRLRARESVSLAGGVTADHVILNFTGRRGFVSAQDGVVNGTVLAPRYSVHLNGSTVNGEVIAGGEEIDLQHNSRVNFVAFDNGDNNPPPPPVTGATFAGLAFLDMNHNGAFDAGESLAGTIITLTDENGVATPAIVGSDGTYSFGTVSAGTYTLSAENFTSMSGTATVGTGATVPGAVEGDNIAGIQLNNGDSATGYNFFYYPNS